MNQSIIVIPALNSIWKDPFLGKPMTTKLSLISKSILFQFLVNLALILSLGCAKHGKHMPLDPQSAPTTSARIPKAATPKPEDPNSCTKVIEFEVGYNEDIMPIINQKCKMCHSIAPANWTDYKTFAAAKDRLLNRVFEKQDMPMKGFPQLTKEEQETLKLWIDIGTPETKEVLDNSLCTENKMIYSNDLENEI